MNILENVSLKLYSTMRLGGTARYLCTAKTKTEVRQAEEWAEKRQLPIVMIGSGSNIIWRDDGYEGLVVVCKIPGFKKIAEDDESVTIWVGGGKMWNQTVSEAVAMGLSGIEALAYIPGTTGAAPVQNIGAYGQEISRTLISVEAYDRMQKEFVEIPNAACNFSYRSSRFKTTDKGRFLITSLKLKLSKEFLAPPHYRDLDAYFEEHKIKKFDPLIVRDAVIAIRTAKLPNPDKIANCGSFFGNPIIDREHFKHIATAYPSIKKPPKGWSQPPHWVLEDGRVKISAGWLVEQAGFSAYSDPSTGMSIWPKQNLVLVNDKAHSTSDLLDFRQKILDKVQAMFGISLEQEPELLP
jgi:UDP-N-acetylmuramate dehydrogenase